MKKLETEQDRVTVKGVKIAEFASEETTCYRAAVYFDGVKIGDAENQGQGGCTFIRALPGKHAELEAAEAFARTLPDVVTDLTDPHDASKPFAYKVTLDGLVDGLVDAERIQRYAQRRYRSLAKSHIVYVQGGKLYHTGKLAQGWDLARLAPMIRAKHDGARILNELPEAEAIAEFVARI